MDPREIEQHLGRLVRGQILIGENMRKHTSWRIGGPADIMLLPGGIDDVRLTLEFARQHEIPVTVVGNGSNLLVKDKGIRGIVLKMSRGFNNITVKGTTITAEAGALVPLLARKAAEAGLSGLEFAVGIPGSVGGAVRMNAGAHNRSMSEVVGSVTALTAGGDTVYLRNGEIGFEYRKSNIKDKEMVVLTADFNLVPGDPAEIMAKNETNLAKRRRSQPLEYPNAGSVFANPPGQWAGWLIEQAVGKGVRVGDAMVSHKHANFIVNLGNATAEDVLNLIDLIRNAVLKKFNIELKLEVQVVGE